MSTSVRQLPFPIISSLSGRWAVLRPQPVAITTVTQLSGAVRSTVVGHVRSRLDWFPVCGKCRSNAIYSESPRVLFRLARFLKMYGVSVHTHALEA